MNILVIPTIREKYKNQLEYSIDLRLISFLKKTFKNSKIKIFHEKTKIQKTNLIIYSGGNSLKSKKKYDKKRAFFDNKIFKIACNKKIKQIGICYGAQFLAKKFQLNITNTKKHVGKHLTFFRFKNKKFCIKTNSFHNHAIKITNKLNYINFFGISQDNFVESYHIKKNKILGIMWHPERNKKLSMFDKKIFRKFYATNNFSSW